MAQYTIGSRPLEDKVAVVVGASRGIGRGIAMGLGEAGATVYIVARSVGKGQPGHSGTIDETAELVNEAGGRAIPVACDVTDDAQVDALFARVYSDQDRIDVLVNSAMQAPGLEEGPFYAPFWQLSPRIWDQMHASSLRANFIASANAARKMIDQRSGLIVNISSFGAVRYHCNVPYHAAKAGLDKMTADMAYELRPYGVAAVSIWPDVVLSENVLAHPAHFNLRKADTPLFIGRLVAALAADPATIHKSGMALGSFELGRDFAIPDPLPEGILGPDFKPLQA